MKLVSGFLSAVLANLTPLSARARSSLTGKATQKQSPLNACWALMPVPEARISSRIVSMSSYPVGPVHSSVAGNRSLGLSLVILAQPRLFNVATSLRGRVSVI